MEGVQENEVLKKANAHFATVVISNTALRDNGHTNFTIQDVFRCTVKSGKGRGGKEKNKDKKACQYHIIFLVQLARGIKQLLELEICF